MLKILLIVNSILLLICFYFTSLLSPFALLINSSLLINLFLLSFCVFVAYSFFKKKYDILFIVLFSVPFLGDSITRLLVSLSSLLFFAYGTINLNVNRKYFFIASGFSCAIIGALIRSFKIDLDYFLIIDNLNSLGLSNNFNILFSYSYWNIVNFLEYIQILFLPFALTSLISLDELKSILNSTFYKLLFPFLIIFLCQFYLDNQLFSLNRGEFWHLTNRYSANFSDPNALGVMSALICIYLFEFGLSKYKSSLIAVYVFIALFSGSRTFFVLFLIYLFTKLTKFNKKILSNFFKLGLVLTISLFVLKNHLPESINRLCDSFTPGKIYSSLESRIIYSKISYEIIKQHGLTGVGLGRFFFEQENFAKKAGIDLGPWRDNANNYYSQIVTEGGVISLIIVLISICLYLHDIKNEKTFRILTPFFIALILGPHLNFIEVKIFISTMFAISIIDSRDKSNSLRLSKSVILLCISYLLIQIMTPPPARSYGLYNLEKNNDWISKRWTSKHVKICINDNINEDKSIFLINNGPLSNVKISNNLGDIITLNSGQTFNLQLPKHLNILELNIDKTWVPYSYNGSNDYRNLGIQISWPSKTKCL